MLLTVSSDATCLSICCAITKPPFFSFIVFEDKQPRKTRISTYIHHMLSLDGASNPLVLRLLVLNSLILIACLVTVAVLYCRRRSSNEEAAKKKKLETSKVDALREAMQQEREEHGAELTALRTEAEAEKAAACQALRQQLSQLKGELHDTKRHHYEELTAIQSQNIARVKKEKRWAQSQNRAERDHMALQLQQSEKNEQRLREVVGLCVAAVVKRPSTQLTKLQEAACMTQHQSDSNSLSRKTSAASDDAATTSVDTEAGLEAAQTDLVDAFIQQLRVDIAAQRNDEQLNASEATARLVALCRAEDDIFSNSLPTRPDLDVVTDAVERGADINFQDPHSRRGGSILHHLIAHHLVQSFLICLSCAMPIDFRITDQTGNTVLHLISRLPTAMARDALVGVVKRMAQNPRDQVDWRHKNKLGRDVMNNAAGSDQLCLFWRVVTGKEIPGLRVPYFDPYVCECLQGGSRLLLELTTAPSVGEWERLGADAMYFQLVRGGPRTTSLRLVTSHRLKTISEKSCPDLVAVHESVEDGADVTFKPEKHSTPALHQFVALNLVACVKACLMTPNPIDFTIADDQQYTPLHWACSGSHAAVMLRLILQRLDEYADLKDIVDWSRTEKKGLDLLSLAAVNKRLHVVWPLLKELPYYRQLHRPIHLSSLVFLSDWRALASDEERAVFFHSGITPNH